MRPPPEADRMQYSAPVIVKDKAAYKESEPPLLPQFPAITVLPAHPFDINRRALAQSRRYIAAQSKERETNNSVRVDLQEFGDVSVIPARDPLESQSTPEEQDLDAAGTLLAVAQEQRAISTTPEYGDMLVTTMDEPEDDIVSSSSWTCPVSTCEYHHKRFSLKVERDEHTRTHFGGIACGHHSCRCAPFTFIYGRFQDLKNHVIWDHNPEYLECQNCFHNLSRSDYLNHLDDCIVHTVEREASANALLCPVSSCDNHHTAFPSWYVRAQHLFHYHSDARVRRNTVMWCPECPMLSRH